MDRMFSVLIENENFSFLLNSTKCTCIPYLVFGCCTRNLKQDVEECSANLIKMKDFVI